MNEPRWVSEATLLAIHAQQVERFGGLHGVRDKSVVQSALARPMNKWAYDPAAKWSLPLIWFASGG